MPSGKKEEAEVKRNIIELENELQNIKEEFKKENSGITDMIKGKQDKQNKKDMLINQLDRIDADGKKYLHEMKIRMESVTEHLQKEIDVEKKSLRRGYENAR